MPAAAQHSTAIVLDGTFGRSTDVNEHFRTIRSACHLISPSATCPALPSGCVVTCHVVPIDSRTEAHSVGSGRYSLLKVALSRLAHAAGICWLKSQRTDDGRHPYVVAWSEQGIRQGLDGQMLVVSGDYQLDLRDGTAATEEVYANIRDCADDEERRGRGDAQLRRMRAKILERAQTGARNRAIRDALEVRSYTLDELLRPFVVARAVYLGHDEDPAQERENKRAIRDNYLNGVRGLFGPTAERPRASEPEADAAPNLTEAPVARQIPPSTNTASGTAPRPAPVDGGASFPRPAASAAAEQGASRPGVASAAPRDPAHRAPHSSGFVIPAGRSKGTPIEHAESRDLEHWIHTTAGKLSRGEVPPRFIDKDTRMLEAMRGELSWRSGEGAQDDEAGAGDDNIPY